MKDHANVKMDGLENTALKESVMETHIVIIKVNILYDRDM